VEIDKKIQVSESNKKNIEISINYTTSDRNSNRIETTIDDVFVHNIALEVLKDNKDHEPTSIEERRHRSDW
jgi:phosphopantothenate synthetase